MLTEDQIQSLFTFLEKKKIKDYDLKMELADHLSEAIEEEMKTEPDFNVALQNVYKSFGIFGFNKVVEEKTGAIEKVFKHEYNSVFNQYFTLPKILATIFLCFLFIYLGYLWGKQNSVLFIGCLAFSVLLFGIVTNLVIRKKYKKPTTSLICLPKKNFIPEFIIYWTPYLIFKLTVENFNLSSHNFVSLLGIYYSIIIITILAKAQAYKALYYKARKDYPLAFQN